MQGQPRYTAGHAYAAMAVSGAVRGFLQRMTLKRMLDEGGASGMDSQQSEGLQTPSGECMLGSTCFVLGLT